MSLSDTVRRNRTISCDARHSEERSLDGAWPRGVPPFSLPDRLPPRRSAVPVAHETADPLALGGWRVGAARVELLVARDQVGAVGAQPVHEDLLDLAAQVQADPP